MTRSSERSIAGQIEFWAQLGRAIEPATFSLQTRRFAAKENAMQLL
jgi:ParD-like antitoxin of type II bacterial toxin-antitoxin system